nr:hypothetical protein [Rathayibacter rathayi]
MAHAVTEHERLTGTRIDIDHLALDDEPTFELLHSTRTLGVFQLESPGQMELVGKLQPTEFNDLTVEISLFRPGPMQNNMPLQYLRARHGEVSPTISTAGSARSCAKRAGSSSSTSRSCDSSTS